MMFGNRARAIIPGSRINNSVMIIALSPDRFKVKVVTNIRSGTQAMTTSCIVSLANNFSVIRRMKMFASRAIIARSANEDARLSI